MPERAQGNSLKAHGGPPVRETCVSRGTARRRLCERPSQLIAPLDRVSPSSSSPPERTLPVGLRGCRIGLHAAAARCHVGAHLLPTHGPHRRRHRPRRPALLQRRRSGCKRGASASALSHPAAALPRPCRAQQDARSFVEAAGLGGAIHGRNIAYRSGLDPRPSGGLSTTEHPFARRMYGRPSRTRLDTQARTPAACMTEPARPGASISPAGCSSIDARQASHLPTGRPDGRV